jgi:elongation factor Ts
MPITAKTVSELRERTGAPLMDCKRALEEAGGDMELAVDNLRKKGLKNADKRAGRKAGAGRVEAVFAPDHHSGAMVLMTSETDFVPPTDDFRALLSKLAKLAFDERVGGPEQLLALPLGSTTVAETVKQLTGKTGENIEVAQASFFDSQRGVVGGYIHHDNKTAALVSLTTGAPADKALEFAKQLGMHITFARPQALSRDQIPADAVERERAVYLDSDEVKAKPEERRAKIVEGKLEKFFADKSLYEQPWFKDADQKVKKVLADALGADSKIAAFALFQVGA